MSTSIAELPEETQMIVDPVTTGLIVVGVVAFLQTRFSLKVRRKSGGKVDVELSVSKDAASEDTLKQVISAVNGKLPK